MVSNPIQENGNTKRHIPTKTKKSSTIVNTAVVCSMNSSTAMILISVNLPRATLHVLQKRTAEVAYG